MDPFAEVIANRFKGYDCVANCARPESMQKYLLLSWANYVRRSATIDSGSEQ